MIYSNPSLKTSDFKYYFSSNKINVLSIDNYPNCFWSNSSAESLAIIYKAISKKKQNIYLPKYFCGQSLKFLRGVNANIIFYDIDKNFNIDYKKINKTCKVQESDIFVVVHYFGKINKYDELLNLKSKIDFTIIEDCAHIISPYIINNWIGDFLIFSPHKHFPLPVLGLIFSKKKINHAYLGFKKFDLVWLIKQFIKKLIITNSKTSWGIKWSKNKNLINKEAPNKLSVRIATNYLKDFNELKKVIKKNYFEASDILNNYSGWKIIGNYYETPYGIIVKCNTLDIAKKNYYLFNKKNNLVMQWPDLPIEIKENNNHLSTVDLANKILFFFIDHRFNNKKWIKELKKTVSVL
jgi:hypothetical protein